ncbi:DUF7285 family protein [Candidatus Halobonum tyrrellensis]|uniref:Uncharacterized protein n=1 Tax=Candidatus Halobonum tyrrellensis G22 TaxID=1324957 RepID=V4GS11_9EURY|nr:hypothetical protein [Candidatus Halobonum tyrrellensis]ESP87841.1 hypothetical protein K933_12041 [Candidatus Halobonum tyrrellensis G22]
MFAVVLGLGAYAVVLTDAAPGDPDRSLAPPTVERAHDELVTGGVVAPDRLPAAVRAAGPDGYEVNATLRAAGRSWVVGPAPPGDARPGGGSDAAAADRASRSVAVRLGPGRVRPGALRVVVWS